MSVARHEDERGRDRKRDNQVILGSILCIEINSFCVLWHREPLRATLLDIFPIGTLTASSARLTWSRQLFPSMLTRPPKQALVTDMARQNIRGRFTRCH